MNKNKRMLLALVFVIVIAIAAGFLLWYYLNPQKTTIYTFNDNYEAGTLVTSDMLTSVRADSSIVVGGSNTDTNTRFVTGNTITDTLNAGNTLKMDVSDGMPLTYSMLSVSGGTSIEMSMDSENVAVTVLASEATGITSDVETNSHVNIYATGWDGSDGTTLIFQNVRVLAVNEDGGAVSSLTVELTVEQSLKLINAMNNSSLYFGIVDASGYQSIDDDTTFNRALTGN